jgi:hypothetical protein
MSKLKFRASLSESETVGISGTDISVKIGTTEGASDLYDGLFSEPAFSGATLLPYYEATSWTGTRVFNLPGLRAVFDYGSEHTYTEFAHGPNSFNFTVPAVGPNTT